MIRWEAEVHSSGPALAHLRAAVIDGRWDEADEVCAQVRARGEVEAVLLDRIRSQVELHRRASPLLPPIGRAPAVDPLGDDRLSAALARAYAAVDGDRPRAQAEALRSVDLQLLDLQPSDLRSGPVVDVRALQAVRGNSSLVRLRGALRPFGGCDAVLGDVAGPERLALGGVTPSAARGTLVEVIGAWDEPTGRFVGRSSSVLCPVPDYRLVCSALDRLGQHRGQADPPLLLGLVGRADLHPSVAASRAQRRIGEWERVLAAAEVLEGAQAAGALSLDALAAVQRLVVPPSTPRAGQLRQTAALIRWGGVVTFRAPPVADARRRSARFLADLSERLSDQGPTAKPGDPLRSNDHPVYLAAEAVASITGNHPFADGNGRTARAVATWLLLRAGFARRDTATLSTVLDDHIDEHFAALRHHRASPWAWHQLVADAVLASFQRPANVAC